MSGSSQEGKSVHLKNWATGQILQDTLHLQSFTDGSCRPRSCAGSFMNTIVPVGPVRSAAAIEKEAKPFIDDYYRSISKFNSQEHHDRWAEIKSELSESGTYHLKYTELAFGAKTAWRNAYRCIGRIQWNKLQVFDARFVGTAQGMFEQICSHLRYATNNGNLRSAITVFPHRQSGRQDFRVWNSTLIGYACYKQLDGSLLGDPVNLELTEAAIRLGWRGKGTHQDILPIVVQAGDGEAKFFDLPSDLVLEVPLTHPEYQWFEKLGYKWFAVPGVSSMKLDVGGLEFSAIPFSGWYMETEIGARDLTDPQRYNITETVAKKMGLNTSTNNSLWKDKAVVEINLAVLHSFQKNNVTIMDHHSTVESFMKHMENEFKIRGGCPGDWVWLIPPISGSLVPMFHQEILSYLIKPMYDYQDQPWKKYNWNKHLRIASEPKKNRRFKEIARAVRFSSKLFKKAYLKRVKATIIYATETGRSLSFANQLADIFSHAFQTKVVCMADYDPSKLEYEQILLIVASTFGNGDAPENGESFARELLAAKGKLDANEGIDDGSKKPCDLHTLLRASDIQEDRGSGETRGDKEPCPTDENLLPLASVRFSVFALGSTAYPKFCAFGKLLDRLLETLGAERVNALACGDELNSQEQSFKEWASSTFKACCDIFCIQPSSPQGDGVAAASRRSQLSDQTVQIVLRPESQELDFATSLRKTHSREILPLKLVSNHSLTPDEKELSTMEVILSLENLELEKPVSFKPGDHVGILPCNQSDLVNGILEKVTNCPTVNIPVEIQIREEISTIAGPKFVWKSHSKLPIATITDLFTRFLDITTPPTQKLLGEFAVRAKNSKDKEQLTTLATNVTEYESWKHWKWPHLLEVFEEFPSIDISASLLAALLPLMQPRLYSVSSSLRYVRDQVRLTVGIVKFRTQDGNGPLHYGVCSDYLSRVKPGEIVHAFFRSEPRFYLPSDESLPIVMVGPGTGVAPFRSFWMDRCASVEEGRPLGRAVLYFGCRKLNTNIYEDEKKDMERRGVLELAPTAYSRETTVKKSYVQDKLLNSASSLYDLLVEKGGHFYVCGDCTMADEVRKALRQALVMAGNMEEKAAEEYLTLMQSEGRYHEDIFGITLRAAQVHKMSSNRAEQRES